MKIVLAADHAGFKLKEKIKAYLKKKEFKVVDCGAFSLDKADDYPVFIKKAAKIVSKDPFKVKAIIFGKSGQGEAIVANRFQKVRAAVYYGGPLKVIKLSREHNDSNVLSLGAGFLNFEEAKKAVKLWLATPFSKEQRHQRRIKQIDNL
jgi:ribose 5-phosphate isomerase B